MLETEKERLRERQEDRGERIQQGEARRGAMYKMIALMNDR